MEQEVLGCSSIILAFFSGIKLEKVLLFNAEKKLTFSYLYLI